MPPGERVGLFTDLYEFTMAQAYLEHDVTGEAVFDLHVRNLPPGRGYMVAAGLNDLLERLDRFTFSDEDLAYLEQLGLGDELLAYLDGFSFEGEIRAIPEGRLAFPYEPLVQVRAPMPMAQIVETLVLNTIHVSTLLATKASRCFQAVRGPEDPERAPALVDFGARRAHGADAARAAARAAYLAGFAGTSLVGAARELAIPCYGTVAHSFVQSFDQERDAFEAFASSFPEDATFLIDTYDTLEGARLAAEVAHGLAEEGVEVDAVRIDSGDLNQLSRKVREILDRADLDEMRILASGGLDEIGLRELTQAGAPVDGYGVGTSLVVSSDQPSLDLSYKLVTYEGEPVLKTSPGKGILPGEKQIHRRVEDDRLVGDTLAEVDEDVEGDPLLEPAEHIEPAKALAVARERFLDEFPRLPSEHRALEAPTVYPVDRSPGLQRLEEQALERVRMG